MKSQRNNKTKSLSRTRVNITESPKRFLRSTSKKPEKQNTRSNSILSKPTKNKQSPTKNKQTPTKSSKTTPNAKISPTKNKKTTKNSNKKSQSKKKIQKPKVESKIIEEDNQMEVDETDQQIIKVDDENITLLQKNGAIVDIHCDDYKNYTVVKDKKNYNSFLSATLNFCNVKRNNNKFYILQILYRDQKYYFYRRWGRNGYKGSCEKIVNYFKLALC
jgi:hypothetical protein